jgi:NADH dehydrogenase FAD-containing subunit
MPDLGSFLYVLSTLQTNVVKGYSDDLSKKLLHKLTNELHVEVILNERINLTPEETSKESTEQEQEIKQQSTSTSEFNGFSHKTLQTDKGRSIESDIQFVCIGTKPRNDLFVNNDLFKDKVDPHNGRLNVNDHMQVEGLKNIFCIGDVCNTKEGKTLFPIFLSSSNHVSVVENSIFIE